MQLRRTLATTTAVLALAMPLTSCGFDYATARDYTPAAGANDRSGDVDVLNAVIVSATKGSGTLIASLSNNLIGADDTQALTGVRGDADEIAPVTFDPVEIEPGALVNLAEPPVGLSIDGDFEAGDVVTLWLEFASGQSTQMNVPVVPNDTGYWEGLDVRFDATEATE